MKFFFCIPFFIDIITQSRQHRELEQEVMLHSGPTRVTVITTFQLVNGAHISTRQENLRLGNKHGCLMSQSPAFKAIKLTFYGFKLSMDSQTEQVIMRFTWSTVKTGSINRQVTSTRKEV